MDIRELLNSAADALDEHAPEWKYYDASERDEIEAAFNADVAELRAAADALPDLADVLSWARTQLDDPEAGKGLVPTLDLIDDALAKLTGGEDPPCLCGETGPHECPAQ